MPDPPASRSRGVVHPASNLSEVTSPFGTDTAAAAAPTEPAIARAPSARLGFFGAAGLLTAVSWQVVVPVLPLHLARIGYSAAQIGILASVLSLAMGVVELDIGRIAAALGRRRTLLGGLAMHGAALLWMVQARAAAAVGLALAAVGSARATMWTPLMAGIAEDAAAHARGRAFGTFWTMTSVGFLVGPAVGGFVASQYGDRAAFYLGTALSMLAMPIVLPITTPGRPAAAQPRGHPVEVLREPAFRWLCVANHLHYAVSAVWVTFLPLYAATRGLSVFTIGGVFAVQGLAYAICQFPTGRLADRIGAERLIVPAVVGRAAISLLVPLAHAPTAFFTLGAVYGFIGGVVPVSFTTLIARITPRDRYTSAMGVYNSSGDLGFFVGPLLGGAAALLGIAAPFFLCAPLGAAAWLSAVAATRAVRARPE
jgi:DHA1 family multidrug resistance protein-like MFS transporter